MPFTFTAPQLAALESEFCSLGGLVRVATPSPVRLWTGVGDLPVNDSAFDADGTNFQGGARLIGMPAFQALWNGLAERIKLTLSGVDDAMRDLVYDEADDVRGAIVRLGLILFDANWAQIGNVFWMRRGRVDMIETDNRPGNRGRIKSISFSLGSQMTGRNIPNLGTYTNADQQSRPGSEDDRFCELTTIVDREKKWPA